MKDVKDRRSRIVKPASQTGFLKRPDVQPGNERLPSIVGCRRRDGCNVLTLANQLSTARALRSQRFLDALKGVPDVGRFDHDVKRTNRESL